MEKRDNGFNEQFPVEVDWKLASAKAESVVLDEDDAPELTDEVMARMRPAHEVLANILPPDVVAKVMKKPGRPKSPVHKESVTIRLDPEVLNFFRKEGRGWQTRINEVLAGYVAAQL